MDGRVNLIKKGRVCLLYTSSNVEGELKKIGLRLINVNVTDISDESGYISALGKEAAAKAINDAKKSVAEKERDGSIGEANANRDQRVQVAQANSIACLLYTTILIGAVLNIMLDPLFIFALKMGVRGAALATVLSQMVSACWVLGFLRGKRAIFKLRREAMRLKWKTVKEIVSLGMSGFIMAVTNGLVQIVCNATLQQWGGDIYVGVMTVLNSVREVLTMPVMGLTNGAQPFLGFNYGAGEYKSCLLYTSPAERL